MAEESSESYRRRGGLAPNDSKLLPTYIERRLNTRALEHRVIQLEALGLSWAGLQDENEDHAGQAGSFHLADFLPARWALPLHALETCTPMDM